MLSTIGNAAEKQNEKIREINNCFFLVGENLGGFFFLFCILYLIQIFYIRSFNVLLTKYCVVNVKQGTESKVFRFQSGSCDSKWSKMPNQ